MSIYPQTMITEGSSGQSVTERVRENLRRLLQENQLSESFVNTFGGQGGQPAAPAALAAPAAPNYGDMDLEQLMQQSIHDTPQPAARPNYGDMSIEQLMQQSVSDSPQPQEDWSIEALIRDAEGQGRDSYERSLDKKVDNGMLQRTLNHFSTQGQEFADKLQNSPISKLIRGEDISNLPRTTSGEQKFIGGVASPLGGFGGKIIANLGKGGVEAGKRLAAESASAPTGQVIANLGNRSVEAGKKLATEASNAAPNWQTVGNLGKGGVEAGKKLAAEAAGPSTASRVNAALTKNRIPGIKEGLGKANDFLTKKVPVAKGAWKAAKFPFTNPYGRSAGYAGAAYAARAPISDAMGEFAYNAMNNSDEELLRQLQQQSDIQRMEANVAAGKGGGGDVSDGTPQFPIPDDSNMPFGQPEPTDVLSQVTGPSVQAPAESGSAPEDPTVALLRQYLEMQNQVRNQQQPDIPSSEPVKHKGVKGFIKKAGDIGVAFSRGYRGDLDVNRDARDRLAMQATTDAINRGRKGVDPLDANLLNLVQDMMQTKYKAGIQVDMQKQFMDAGLPYEIARRTAEDASREQAAVADYKRRREMEGPLTNQEAQAKRDETIYGDGSALKEYLAEQVARLAGQGKKKVAQ